MDTKNDAIVDFLNRVDFKNDIYAYTDGACSGNPGVGGWGVVLKQNNLFAEVYGGEIVTTNNKMELTAAINGLRHLPDNSNVVIVTDSKYVKNGIECWILAWKRNGWKTSEKKPVKNQELWVALDEARQNKNVSWEWVKGHSGVDDNEKADALARQAIVKLMVTGKVV